MTGPNRDYVRRKRSNVARHKATSAKTGHLPRKKEEKKMRTHGAGKKGSKSEVDTQKLHDVTEEENESNWQNVPEHLELSPGKGEGKGKNPSRSSTD